MIDDKDFSILRTIDHAQTPVWKKEIHRRVLEATERLPGPETISIQTICRRVKDLYDNNYLLSRLTNTDQVNKTLIHTYELTSKGQNALQNYRETTLKDWAITTLHSQLADPVTPPETDTDVIRHLFCDHYDIPEHHRDDLQRDHLLKLLTDHYLDQELAEVEQQEDYQQLTATLRQHNPDLLEDSGKT